ncbi:MAG: primosomal protein N', partial [Planctomycetales bacterium]|nr:primosomal protein N' [Planctomycetales bacterium]
MQADQQAALDAISAALHAGRHEQFLLFGVTGSGKTEVYIRAIDEVVARGRQAIVMVPEISLTPQTRQRFRARFDRVAVLHSHMTDSERSWHWERIAAGGIDVVVGARSAVFAPTPSLGLIVIDEEHEGSFKQEQTPRYHARAAAAFRTRAANAPLVLGSATPSLESWHAARSGAVRLLEMPRRVMSRPLPAVRVVDLCQERASRSPGAIGRPLFQAMRQTLADDGQVILLLNRRGFSTHIQCHACGEALHCPHCDIALTHHRDAELAICHYCDYREPLRSTCPNCDMPGLNYGGLGTQKLESEVRARI